MKYFWLTDGVTDQMWTLIGPPILKGENNVWGSLVERIELKSDRIVRAETAAAESAVAQRRLTRTASARANQTCLELRLHDRDAHDGKSLRLLTL